MVDVVTFEGYAIRTDQTVVRTADVEVVQSR